MRKSHVAFLTATVIFVGTTSWANDDCLEPEDDLALSDYLAQYESCIEGRFKKVDTSGATDKENVAAAVNEFQAASPASPSAGSASERRDSIENYLSLFSFAVDGVSTSEDDKSLTLRFNPIRSGSLGSLGISVTGTEPEAADFILQEVVEGARSGVQEALTSGLDETDNLTVEASFAFERKAGKHEAWLLGRSYKNYRSLVEREMLPIIADSEFSGSENDDLLRACSGEASDELLKNSDVSEDDAVNLYSVEIRHVRAALGANWEHCIGVWEASKVRVVNAAEKLDALSWIPFLIDNQPQLSLTAELQERAEEVGRSGWNVKVSYEKGIGNLNTLLRRVRGKSGDEWRDAFFDTVGNLDTKEVEAENKFTFSLAYAEVEPYTFDRTVGEGDDAVFLNLDLPRTTELSWKIEYHRNATWHRMNIVGEEVIPKFHASVEYQDLEPTENMDQRDRLVGILTYEIPLPSGVTLPLSLTYANHARFLGEVDDELSAHFGISYKLPGTGGD